jgi:general secretion pathway protein M
MKLASMNDWYASREPRERRMLLVGVVAALVIVLAGVLMPLYRSVTQTRARVETKTRNLQWMQQVAPALANAGPAPVVPDSGESLVVLIDRSARESGLGEALTGSQPGGTGTLRVTLSHAEFNSLIAWLARLVNQHGLQVESVTADAVDDAGFVNATVVVHSRS